MAQLTLDLNVVLNVQRMHVAEPFNRELFNRFLVVKNKFYLANKKCYFSVVIQNSAGGQCLYSGNKVLVLNVKF